MFFYAPFLYINIFIIYSWLKEQTFKFNENKNINYNYRGEKSRYFENFKPRLNFLRIRNNVENSVRE